MKAVQSFSSHFQILPKPQFDRNDAVPNSTLIMLLSWRLQSSTYTSWLNLIYSKMLPVKRSEEQNVSTRK